jgi:hypothetical protein
MISPAGGGYLAGYYDILPASAGIPEVRGAAETLLHDRTLTHVRWLGECQDELLNAEQAKRVFPILYQDCDVPFRLADPVCGLREITRRGSTAGGQMRQFGCLLR